MLLRLGVLTALHRLLFVECVLECSVFLLFDSLSPVCLLNVLEKNDEGSSVEYYVMYVHEEVAAVCSVE